MIRRTRRNIAAYWTAGSTTQIDGLIFRFTDDTQPYHFNAAFERLLTAADLLCDGARQKRTLYSLRHIYATLELRAGTDIHTLAKQMGTSVLMLKRFYSKLDATMAAARLAQAKLVAKNT